MRASPGIQPNQQRSQGQRGAGICARIPDSAIDRGGVQHPHFAHYHCAFEDAGLRQVTEAYLLFSYDGIGYPFIRLSVGAQSLGRPC